MNYNQFQNNPSSSKVVLAVLSGSRRLMGWTEHSEGIFKIEFKAKVIETLQVAGWAFPMQERDSVENLDVDGTYYLDRVNEILYVKSYYGLNPNTDFYTVTVKFYFANEPLTLPWNLTDGFDVFWEPVLKTTSEFGNVIDTINQVSESIDGSGSLALINDIQFWTSNFDKWTFDNKSCVIYSWSREVPLSDIQILFRGLITDKKYSSQTINFQLKDQFKMLRQSIDMYTIGELGMRSGEDQSLYKTRYIFGRVFGHRPINVDRILDGYPLTGTVEGVFDLETESVNLVFSGTKFLSQVSPHDNLIINGFELEVEEVLTDTTLVFADEELPFTQAFGPVTFYIDPQNPRRYMNRVYNVCGHVTRQPGTVCIDDSTIDTLRVESNRDIYPGDMIYIGMEGSGELAKVRSVAGNNLIYLSTSLGEAPTFGTPVFRPSIQNVKYDEIPLVYERDYWFDADGGMLYINEDAELNAAPLENLGFDVTFTENDREVTGQGFSLLRPGMFIGQVGQLKMFEIHSIIDDTTLMLTEPATFTGTALGRYKNRIISEDTIITCDVMGMTEDGTKEGILIKTAPQVCRHILRISPLDPSYINHQSFLDAQGVVYQEIGIAIPERYDDANTPTYIDVMNEVNRSVFGAIVIKHEGLDTSIHYHALQPKKSFETTKRFNESDMLKFSFDATSKYTVKKVILEYQHREYNPIVRDSSFLIKEKENKHSEFVIGTENVRVIKTKLVSESDARIMAGRWSFLLSDSMGSLEFTTKMQGALLNVGDVIEIEHSKMFDRQGGGGKRRIFMVESVRKNGYNVSVKCVDFSNTFNKVACITDIENNFQNATETEKLYGGFYTDDYGMQNNESDTYGLNLIW